jgi:hypothetical protein
MNSINPKHVRYLENKSDSQRKSRIQSEIAVGMYSFPIRDQRMILIQNNPAAKSSQLYLKRYIFFLSKSLSLFLSSFLPAF